MTISTKAQRRAHKGAADKAHGAEQLLSDRIVFRLNEWCRITGQSRQTIWRHHKRGVLRLVYQGDIPYVPRSEAVRLGFLPA